MKWSHWSNSKHCKWCGKGYEATKPAFGDGFCSGAHKQAHYRAYKKYVTAAARIKTPSKKD